ncbi:Na+/citrate or Na+/malate symporter [Bacillus sp. OAE603]
MSYKILVIITFFTILGLIICFIKSIKKDVLWLFLFVLLLGTIFGYFGLPTIERTFNF